LSKPPTKKRVLFVCTHNSARSQMAEGLMNADHANGYEAQSGGTEPAQVNPYAIRAMSEIGIDISHRTSKSVDQFLDQDLDYVVTVCDHANEACPFFPGGKIRLHKGFEDPAAVEGTDAEKLEAFRRIRDEIRDWIDHELVGFEV
jgi:arsenate reductase